MSEIKFRLRNRANKIVGYEKWYTGAWDDGYWIASPCWLYSYDGKSWVPVYVPHCKKDSFTGIKDKNGKDIYEGDIWGRNGFIAIVEFKFSSWEFVKADSSNSFQYPYFFSNARTGEVIGNTHENPELLNKEVPE